MLERLFGPLVGSRMIIESKASKNKSKQNGGEIDGVCN